MYIYIGRRGKKLFKVESNKRYKDINLIMAALVAIKEKGASALP